MRGASSSSSPSAPCLPRAAAACGLGGYGGARGHRGWNGATTPGAIAAASKPPPGGFACSLRTHASFRGAFPRRGGCVCVTRAAAAIVASSESVSPRRFPPRQNGPLVWLGAFTGDAACAVVRVGWGARCALCCCAAATGAVVVSAWRRWQQRRTYGGIGGTGRWRRVVAVGTSADAPGLPGNLARSPAAARAA